MGKRSPSPPPPPSSSKATVVSLVILVLSCLIWCCKSSELLEYNCEEIYVVHEGETLQSISEKCGDPFIVEENPHINDPDDVFPGLVIKITPFHHFIKYPTFLTP